MKRVGALIAAVVMVVAALLMRDRINDGNGDAGRAQLVCATELGDACLDLAATVGGLDVTVESAGTTADRLSALPDSRVDDPGFDGWLVPEPWPGIVDVRRQREQRRPVFAPDPIAVARSPLVVVVREDRTDALRERCGGTIAWTCLGEVAGQEWADVGGSSAPGRVRVAHTDPTVSATGLLVLAQATSDFFESTEGTRAFGSFELENTDAFLGWLTRLETSATLSSAPLERMLTFYPTSDYDAVGTTEAEAGPRLVELIGDRPDLRDAFTLLYPDPVATADVVLVLAATDDRAGEIVDLAAGGHALHALAGSGWRGRGEPLAAGLRDDLRLPRESNLPDDAGVFEALQASWKAVTRR